MDFVERTAMSIPSNIRKLILENGFIDIAVDTDERIGTPMEYLFDIYEHFIDKNGEHDDWHCPKCRAHILQQWRNLKPYLEVMQANNS